MLTSQRVRWVLDLTTWIPAAATLRPNQWCQKMHELLSWSCKNDCLDVFFSAPVCTPFLVMRMFPLQRWIFCQGFFHNSFFDSTSSKKTCLIPLVKVLCTIYVAGSSLQFCSNLSRLTSFSFAYSTMVKYYTEQWTDHVFGVAQLGILPTCFLLKGNLGKKTTQGL